MANDIFADQLAAKEVAAAIEDLTSWMIQKEAYINAGWIEIRVDRDRYISDDLDIDEIDKWAQENIKGECRTKYNQWIFELEDDAAMFALRWT